MMTREELRHRQMRPTDGELIDVADDVAALQIVMVNAYFVGQPDQPEGWVLVDAGLPMSATRIRRAAERRFGRLARPAAIVLTHGHFDHVGALPDLAEQWDCPVYAHRLESPYLTGRSSYPPPDVMAGGGIMPLTSALYPRGPIDLGDRLQLLDGEEGPLDVLPGWRWLHTPGHAPGHISLFRESDRVLLAGDAFVTTKQESAIAIALQYKHVHGPPSYFTPDWAAARNSVEKLLHLYPAVAATGHGLPMHGKTLIRQLHELHRDFDTRAVPTGGRYVNNPAVMDERGVLAVPPPRLTPGPVMIGVLAGLGLAAIALGYAASQRDSSRRHRSRPMREYARPRGDDTPHFEVRRRSLLHPGR